MAAFTMRSSCHWTRGALVAIILALSNNNSMFLPSCSGFTTTSLVFLRNGPTTTTTTTTTTRDAATSIRANSFVRLWADKTNRRDAAENLPMLDAQVVNKLATTTVLNDATTTAAETATTRDTHSLTTTTPPKKRSTDPTPVLFSMLQNKPPASALLATMALTLALLLSPLPSWAASTGGRMGGGSFSSPSRSGSLSAPGRGYSQGFRSGYGSSGYYSRPSSVAITPFYNPFYSPFPQPYFFGGPGVVAYSRGPSLFDFLLIGGVLFAVANIVRNAEIGSSDLGWTSAASSTLGSGTAVLQLSVALEVPNRDDPNSILSVLSRLAATARTDSRVGIQNLTSQVALELLRRKSSIVSASSQYQHYSDRNKAQREFQSLAVKERGKFEQETVSKYGGVDYSTRGTIRPSSSSSAAGSGGQATMAVVTLVLAIDGDSTRVGAIRSMVDVEEALRKIAANAKVDDCLQSCEILWTPEDRSETLTLRDVVADYPELRSL